MATARDRLVEAAFALFDERGYDATTVDDIAERAGTGRTTFFRHFGSKEAVIFPDHEQLLGSIRARLAASTHETALVAVVEAARLVLLAYLAEGDRARGRYRLTSSVPSLQQREIAGMRQYQRLFRDFIHEWLGGRRATALQAELMANAVVTAHNHVLRRWLRGEGRRPAADFDAAMAEVMDRFREPSGPVGGTTVLVLQSGLPVDAVLPAVRAALQAPQE